ncbi:MULTISPECIES: phasin family protein [Silvimonas]|uniref:phasin family protein n=1 Tax=Silvimonas TaxID=300264 RepID=UPI0024B34D33|nr:MULTISPECIES: phasin family protein [Silvimonas]MDR3428620.1 phasin family protein [Silvimonas sp.]
MTFGSNRFAEEFSRAQQVGIERSLNYAQTFLAGAERLWGVQLGFAKTVAADNVEAIKAFSQTKDVQGALALQRGLVEPLIEKATAAWRESIGIAQATQQALSELVEQQVKKSGDEVLSGFDAFADQAPAGAEGIKVLRNGVAASLDAYGTTVAAARKQSEEWVATVVQNVTKAAPAANGRRKAA